MSNESLPEYLTVGAIDDHVKRSLDDDLRKGDCTTAWTIPSDAKGSARLIAKEAGLLAGAFVGESVLLALSDTVKIRWSASDGDVVAPGQLLGEFSGRLQSILKGERVMLNYLQRMSGIATRTRLFVEALAGTDTRVLDTRKTAPGLRYFDKWSVLIGGGVNHRLNLNDEVMIKENHIAAAGGLRKTIESVAQKNIPPNRRIVVVEITNPEQIDVALDTGHVDRLLLDNMVSLSPGGDIDVSKLASAVKLVNNRVPTEASGNVTLETVRQIAETGVNFVSVGELTHSVRALDMSLLVEAARP